MGDNCGLMFAAKLLPPVEDLWARRWGTSILMLSVDEDVVLVMFEVVDGGAVRLSVIGRTIW
jgi:hypothetical protein